MNCVCLMTIQEARYLFGSVLHTLEYYGIEKLEPIMKSVRIHFSSRILARSFKAIEGRIN